MIVANDMHNATVIIVPSQHGILVGLVENLSLVGWSEDETDDQIRPEYVRQQSHTSL